MGRYLSPLLFLSAGAYVWWFNANHADRALLFPFLPSLLPSLEGDLSAQGRVTAAFLLAIGGVLLLSALLRRRPRQTED